MKYTTEVRLRTTYNKGWVMRATPSARWFAFDHAGRFILWGLDYNLTSAAAVQAGAFIATLNTTERNRAGRWFEHNCKVVFGDSGFSRVMSYYRNLHKSGGNLLSFCRVIPGYADEPELIAPAVLGLLSCAPVISAESYQSDLKVLRDFAYSLPETTRNNPDHYTADLWLEFDLMLSKAASVRGSIVPQTVPDPEPRHTSAGVSIPQTLSAIAYPRLERLKKELHNWEHRGYQDFAPGMSESSEAHAEVARRKIQLFKPTEKDRQEALELLQARREQMNNELAQIEHSIIELGRVNMSRGRVEATCPRCGSKRWIKGRHKARRNALCKRCHCIEIAPLGYQATVKSRGADFALKFVQARLLANPSNLEVLVARTLDRLNLSYEREFQMEHGAGKSYLVDFAVNVCGIIHFIEVNGAYVHQFHIDRDKEKVQFIEAAGFRVLILNDSDIYSPDLPQTLSQFLTPL